MRTPIGNILREKAAKKPAGTVEVLYSVVSITVWVRLYHRGDKINGHEETNHLWAKCYHLLGGLRHFNLVSTPGVSLSSSVVPVPPHQTP